MESMDICSDRIFPNKVEKALYIVSCYLVPALFLIFIAKPLLQLASEERAGMIILLSKGICLLFGLVGNSFRLTMYILEKGDSPLFIRRTPQKLVLDTLTHFSDYCVQLHIVALAWNRVHATYWTMHYNAYATKRRMLHQCTCLVLFALPVAVVDVCKQLVPNYLAISVVGINLQDLYYVVFDVSSTMAGICYLLLAARLIWIKWQSDRLIQLQQQSNERNFNQIAAAYAFSFVFVLLNNYFTNYADHWNDQYPWSLATSKLIFWCDRLFYYYTVIADELLLLVFIAEFRRLAKCHLARLCHYAICRKYNAPPPTVPIANPILVVASSTTT